MELIQVGKNTYYLKNNTNIGIYKVTDNQVYLIDSGNDKDSGKKILKIITEQGWQILGIINTHSNADHIGGNKVIQDRTNCKIYAYNLETSFIKYPHLESSFLYGGYPFQDLKNKFLLASPSQVTNIKEHPIDGLEYFPLKGHFFDMIGLKTSDNIYFLGDALFSEETINKYHLFFIYDVKEFLNTLTYLESLNGKLYIASHCQITDDLTSLIKINRDKVIEVSTKIYNCCNNKTFEEILQEIFNEYHLVMDKNQYVLVGSTIKSYLSYLYDENKISYQFIANKMVWFKI